MQLRQTKILAKSAMVATLTTALLAIGSTIRYFDLGFNVIAGMILWCFVLEYGRKYGALVYATTSVLGLILFPYKFTAFCYLMVFGLYSLVRPSLEKIRSHALRWVVKLAVVNICVVSLFYLYILLFMTNYFANSIAFALMILSCNIAFIIYDSLLVRIVDVYERRVRTVLCRAKLL